MTYQITNSVLSPVGMFIFSICAGILLLSLILLAIAYVTAIPMDDDEETKKQE